MQSNEVDDLYNTASPCRSGSQVSFIIEWIKSVVFILNII